MKKLLFFLPALIACLFYGWLFWGLGASLSSVSPWGLAAVEAMAAAGILLSMGRGWGWLPGAAVGAALLWWDAAYSGHRHLNAERPLGWLLLAFYAVCGALVWHRRKSTR